MDQAGPDQAGPCRRRRPLILDVESQRASPALLAIARADYPKLQTLCGRGAATVATVEGGEAGTKAVRGGTMGHCSMTLPSMLLRRSAVEEVLKANSWVGDQRIMSNTRLK